MNSCSPFAYFGKSQAEQEDSVDTNVFSLKFNDLDKREKNFVESQPIFCSNCTSAFNSASKFYSEDEYAALSQNVKESPHQNGFSKKTVSEVKKHQKIWICEFCGNHNAIDLEASQIPAQNDAFYMLETAKKNTSTINPEFQKNESIIFCIDNSGSMDQTTKVKDANGKKKYVSRRECVEAAVRTQLKEMGEKYPNRKAGLVMFGSNIELAGDGVKPSIFLPNSDKHDFDKCLSFGINASFKHLTGTIQKNQDSVLTAMKNTKANGATALGPALLAAIGLATQGKPGSQVVICTDGLANEGLGSFGFGGNESGAAEFYEKAGQIAKSRGVMVSIITIKGQGCQVDTLSKVSSLTGGNVTRIDPKYINDDFKSVLQEELAATDVEVKIQIHHALQFRGEWDKQLAQDKSQFKNTLGNVTKTTESTFEYAFKSDEKLAQAGIDSEALKQVPMQAQVTYKEISGCKMLRIITIQQKVTRDVKEAAKNVNIKMIGAHVSHVTSAQAEKGELTRARQINKKWNEFLDQDIQDVNRENEEYQKYYKNYQERNNDLMGHVNKNIKRKIRRKSITMQNQIQQLDRSACSSLMSDVDNLSNEGSDDEGNVNYYQYNRVSSLCYLDSPLRRKRSVSSCSSRSNSRSASPKNINRKTSLVRRHSGRNIKVPKTRQLSGGSLESSPDSYLSQGSLSPPPMRNQRQLSPVMNMQNSIPQMKVNPGMKFQNQQRQKSPVAQPKGGFIGKVKNLFK